MQSIPHKNSFGAKICTFFHNETVLSIAVILALLSMLLVFPDKEYISYIDFRTLGILFCLMTIVAALKEIGLFDWLAQSMLSKVHTIKGIVSLLVLLSFFFSMVITNDVALITFVPLTIIVMKHVTPELRKKWFLTTVVMQTIAANLGSMLTPIGNPQNLYLYGKSGISILEFVRLLLPYSIAALVLLLVWISIESKRKYRDSSGNSRPDIKLTVWGFDTGSIMQHPRGKEYTICYFLLFGISLLSVGHIVPFTVPFMFVLIYSLVRNRQVLKHVDYSLLGTFTALFIFIGNLGRIAWFRDFLQSIITGREALTAVIASQVMSNVPAAILLSGFTDRFDSLIIGTNIGGLGTLIASMASLISFKYIAKEEGNLRGKYFVTFTAANIVFLIVMLLIMWVI